MPISKDIEGYPPRLMANSGDDDDWEEALSLCDIPLYGDAGDCSFSSDDASISSSSDDFFEFSPVYDRDDRHGNNGPGPGPACESRDIIFCGKLIPYEETQSAESLPSNLRIDGHRDHTMKKKKNKARAVTKNTKARAISCTSARCDRWYMLAFGLARFPSEMAMSEIRRRQVKGIRGAVVESAKGGGRTKGKKGGVWWMLKALGCSRRDEADGAGAVVKAFSGRISWL